MPRLSRGPQSRRRRTDRPHPLVGVLGGSKSDFPILEKAVAILNFDYSTVQSGVAAIFGTNQDIGKGVADLLVEKLVKSGQYRVIERKAIDKICLLYTSDAADD